MNNELIKEASKLFPTYEHWDSFWDLADAREEIVEFWFVAATNKIRQHFKESLNAQWGFRPMAYAKTERDTCWFLKEFGEDSLGIYFGWHYQLQFRPPIFYNPEKYNFNNIIKLLSTDPEYDLLLTSFSSIDRNESGSLLLDNRNFEFNGESVRPYIENDLCWYAAYEIDSFVKQAIAKIERFTNNPEVTELIRNLNEVAKNGNSV